VIQRVEEVKLAYLEGVRSDGMSGGGEVVGA
jgi:hypothetical protein